MPDHYPPEHDYPENGVLEVEIAIGVCYDCREVLGPTHSEDVGMDIHLNHGEHRTEILSVWTSVEIIDEELFFNGA